MDMSILLETAKKIVSQNSYFDFCDNSDSYISFRTRENGCVGSETHSIEDLEEGYKLADLLRKELPNNAVTVETVDEWIHIDIIGKTEEVSSYVFYKHSKPFSKYSFERGSGMSWGVTLEGLKKDALRFTNKDIEPFLEKIKDKSFTSDYDSKSRHITFSVPKEEGNEYGYYFSFEEVVKTERKDLDYTSL